MYDRDLMIERLTRILEVLERIPARFSGISAPSDFTDTPSGTQKMDSTCMVLLAAG